MATPSSIRFNPEVLERLRSYVATHPGLSTSSATNQLVDEALRTHEHPMIVFRDGPRGRRARLVGGPDVWEVIRAVRSAQRAEPALTSEETIELVADTAGLDTTRVHAAINYWAAYPDEVDDLVRLADAEEEQAQARWQRERELLG